MPRNPLIIAIPLLLYAGYASAAIPKNETPLLLEAWINGHTKHSIVEAVERKGKLLVDSVTLASAGIKFSLDEIPKDGLIASDALQGVTMVLQSSEQKLEITTTSERLQTQIFNMGLKPMAHLTESDTGFIGQYDLVGTVDNFNDMQNTSTTGAFIGGTLFTPEGNVTANGLVQHQSSRTQAIRFDTRFEQDDHGTMKRLVVGDTITGSQNWSRSVRYGGIQMATDFSLRPDISTMPLPVFFGQAALPSNVDIFVNSARVFEGGVEPGPFQVNNLPVITGSGEATMVVRNALGQETIVTVPFFASNSLLRPGLSSYAIDAGFLRTAYGQESFSYRDALLSGTYSYGARNWLTLETHAEAARDVQLAGGGAVFSVAPYGTVHFASAFSNRSDNSQNKGFGALHSFAIEVDLNPYGFFGSLNTTNGNFADIATMGGTPPPKLQMQIGTNASLGEYGNFATSFIDIRRAKQESSRIATASYTRSIDGKWNMGATGFYDITRKESVMQGFLSYSLSNGLIADANIQGGSQTHQREVGITKPANPDGGYGYHLSASHGDTTLKEGGITWIGQHGSVNGALASRNSQKAARLTASGGLVVMGGEAYATKWPNGSVALVETGAPGTLIYQENRQVATADEDGKALITGLAPFSQNHISIDPSRYKLSTLITSFDKTVTPGRQNGVRVSFVPEPRFPAVILLKMPDGSFPQIGATVKLNGRDEPLVVGRHGEMFIADLHEPVSGTVDDGRGICHFSVNPPTIHSDTIPRIGDVQCIPDQATQ